MLGHLRNRVNESNITLLMTTVLCHQGHVGVRLATVMVATRGACRRSESTSYRIYAESLQRWESPAFYSEVALFR